MNIREIQSKRFDICSKTLTLTVTVLAMGLLFSISTAMEKGVLITDYNVYAQSEQEQTQQSVDDNSSYPVIIKLDSVSFAPLTDSEINQLKVDITYQTNDPKLVNTIMAGGPMVFIYRVLPICLATNATSCVAMVTRAAPAEITGRAMWPKWVWAPN